MQKWTGEMTILGEITQHNHQSLKMTYGENWQNIDEWLK